MAKDLNLSVTLKAINKATGPLKKILQGSRGVGRAMKESREELKGFNDQQKRISAFRDMSRQSLQTRDALREKRQALDRVTQELKTATGPTRRLTQQQAKAQAAVDKLNSEYRDQRDRVRELSRNLPRAEDGTRGLTAQQQALDRQIRATNERLNRQRQAMQRLADADVSGRFSKMTGEVGRLGRRTLIAGGAAAAGIFGIANSTASLGDEVAKSGDKIGIALGPFQELRYAAERSGVSTQKFDSSLERFVKRLGEARQGSGAAAKAYEQLGINADQLAQLTPDAALGVVADRLAQVESHTDKVALAAQFFGREGVAMVNMLKDGSAGLEALRKDARATGYVLSDEAARDAEVFKDAMLDAELGMAGMKNTIGAELMPAITDLMGELSGWMRENRDEVKAFAREFGERLKTAVPVILELGRGVATFAATLGVLTTKAAAAVGGFDNLAMIVGGLFAGKAIASVLSFGIGVGKAIGAMGAFAKTLPIVATGVKALSAVFAATPIGWIVAGITSVALGAAYLWKNWETIGPKFSALWESLKAMPGRAWAGIKAAFQEGVGGVTRLLLDWSPLGILWRGIRAALEALGIDVPAGFSTLGDAIVDGLIGGITAKWQALKEKITGIGGSVIGWFKAKLGIASPSRVFAGFGANLLEGLIDGIDEKWQVLKDKIGSAAGAVTGWFKEKLGINSPSRVFAELGGHTMEGYRQGISRNERGPLREVDAFAKRLRQAGGGLVLGTAAMASGGAMAADSGPKTAPRFDARAPISAPASGGSTLNGGINITINAAPGMDEQALARYVAAEVQRALASAERDAAARQRSAFYDVD
ncbi:hypothetical protein [Halomonas saccharevitans]|uniref:Phage tail tape measure protein, TP901 family, core region n=1 Tax=Halomonas saccharevitans TaxID=416872 RepID=A0A1I7CUX8_9GAMM|nr:hypothetical protein [Halomonas saccharevitans]SFU03186.1 hypothetical protein SAMN04487956_1646 [Halomonas saccharevitans]